MCISWLSVQYNDKKIHFGFFIQLRWARCDLYNIFTVTDRFQPKKSKIRNGSHSSGSGMGYSPNFPVALGRDEICFRGSGTGRDLFSWHWDGTRFVFVGLGWERFENPLPCHPLAGTESGNAMYGV